MIQGKFVLSAEVGFSGQRYLDYYVTKTPARK